MPKMSVNGTSIHYHTAGEGVPILFIHPPVLSGKVFAYQRVQLADSFRVVVFDVRGHGESEASEVPVTYPLIVEDMKQLMDFLGIGKAFLCGYSTACQVALEAMLTYPDRFLGSVMISALPAVLDFWNMMSIRAGVFGASWLPAALRWSIAWGNADGPQTFRNLMQTSQKGCMANIGQYFRRSLSYNAVDRLQSIKQPVLLLYGEKDRKNHSYARLMHAKLPNSTLLFLKGAPHQIPTKAASRMNGLIQCWIHERLNVKAQGDECLVPPELLTGTELRENGSELTV